MNLPVVRRFRLASAIAAIAVLSTTACLHAQQDVVLGSTEPPPILSPAAAAMSDATVQASRKIAPTVVGVSVPPDELSMKRWKYYEEFSGFERKDEQRRRRRLVGSGVFVTRDGYVLTNHHVVENVNRDSIRVITANGDTYRAVLVGSDELTDLAVLRVFGRDFPVPVIANSDSVAVGEWVLAVGNPMSLRSTITAGIISAVGRGGNLDPSDDERRIHNYLQFDAAVNPGNSGGGLFDMRGRLIGIVSALWSANGYFTGYGLAIPSTLARAVALDLIEDGRLDRVQLGISAVDLSDTAARSLRMKSVRGALVDYIDSSSAAARAGIRVRDVITEFDGHSIGSVSELQSILAALRGSTTANVRVWRNGREEVLEARLTRETRRDTASRLKPTLDVQVVDVTAQSAERLNISERSGALVASLDPYGSAAHAGLLKDDVIVAIDDIPVHAADAIQQVLRTYTPGDVVRISAVRDGSQQTFTAVVGQESR